MPVGWSRQTVKRSCREHARKRRAKAQRRHLTRIKGAAALRRIALGARHLR